MKTRRRTALASYFTRHRTPSSRLHVIEERLAELERRFDAHTHEAPGPMTEVGKLKGQATEPPNH